MSDACGCLKPGKGKYSLENGEPPSIGRRGGGRRGDDDDDDDDDEMSELRKANRNVRDIVEKMKQKYGGSQNKKVSYLYKN